ncbi:MAG: GFA family protein [Alphaproteobacteria bacterium]|nr:GFA family protein [Alphaproteobacteria bacterium]
MPALRIEGHCLCRAVAYAYDVEPLWTLHCHCESCRRGTSAPVATWISVSHTGFRWTRGTPKAFSSSPGVTRKFWGTCGSPLTYENERIPDEVHVLAGSLADPSGVKPLRHVFAEEQLPWFEIVDNLPRYATFSRNGSPPERIGPRKA